MNKKVKILSIICFVALMGTVLVGCKKANNQNQNANINISDWETYRNNEYGFEISYPRDWVLSEKKISTEKIGSVVALNSPENEKMLEKIQNGEMYGEGYMETITINYYKDISEEPENIANHLDSKTLEEFVYNNQLISNIKKVLFENKYEAFEMTRGGFGAYFNIMIDKDGEIYEILFGNNYNNKSELPKLEQRILSTFKF